MAWQHLYLASIFLASAISLLIAIYTFVRRSRTDSIIFAAMMLAISEYVLTSGLMSASSTPEKAMVWVDPHYFGLTMMLAFFIIFVIQYTGKDRWINKYTLTAIFSMPFITQIIIETNSIHHWFIQDIQFTRDGILMGLTGIQYGGFFWFHSIYSYTLVLAGIGMLAHKSIRSFKLFRMQSILLLLSILPPLLGSINDSRLFFPGFPYPLVPLCFAVMGITIAWNMFSHQMLRTIPVVREMLVESMSDSMVVLDTSMIIIDVNSSALKILNKDESQVIGQPASVIFQPWIETVTPYRDQMNAQNEIMICVDGNDRYYDLRISPLNDRNKQNIGRIIVLRDITNRKQTEIQLQDSLEEIKALQERLYEQTIHDPLTGLYNRRYLVEVLKREISRAIREQYTLSFVLMDIDHFKSVNDTYGHSAGDQVLQTVAECLFTHTRTGDILFRHGGEEFLAIMVNTPAQAACQYAERCRKIIQNHRIIYNGQEICVTLSMGIAAFPVDGKTPDEVLIAADKALYHAKAAGRNHVAMFLN